ncbi:MAG TPA: cytochrome c [Candidatus Acidoferrum sp.]|nr:cytochrome c [Candidatus Acidoferrum sp.]
MQAMRSAILAAFILAISGFAVAWAAPQHAAKPAAKQSDVDRGRYLVEEVARCPECHTPRDSKGNLERDKWLQGASIWILPVHPTQNWAERVPPLAGLPSYSDEQMERVLEQGEGADGRDIQPPMHTYHLTHEDAVAIIAYLRSLPEGRP